MVKDLRVAMNMPSTLKEFGVSEDEFKSNLDKISEGAVADACTGTNPREISVAEMKKLFEAVYYGKEVNF
jgi:alcohol dehydrogenase class IV